MKKILGIDLGVSSIGWAFITLQDPKYSILGMGSRIIPLDADEFGEFKTGMAASKSQQRTLRRSFRKGMDRYQLRKTYLREALTAAKMLPDADLFSLSSIALYGLRERALSEKLTLKQIGRIFLHLNQKRGYKSSRKDDAADKKVTDYEQAILERHHVIRNAGYTIGQYFYYELKKDPIYRIKEKVFPRIAYVEEFDAIWNVQQQYYPEILTEDFRKRVRDEIIFYQRPLKSQKGLVGFCEFESERRYFYNDKGEKIPTGPKVAPRSTPLSQLCKIWESVNNITIKNKRGEKFEIGLDQKHQIISFLNENEVLSEKVLFDILKIKATDGYYSDTLVRRKGIQGNITCSAIARIIGADSSYSKWLQFEISSEERDVVDPNTAEMLRRKVIAADFEKQPLYQLWHCIYSIAEREELKKTLERKFGFKADIAEQLSKLDFTKPGYSNKSTAAIRNILPHLMLGAKYNDACTIAGYNHSDSITKEENNNRQLQDMLSHIKKNSLRQPVVEKILNQLVNLVNALLADPRYGRPDEIRVELARELKQSRDERSDAFKRNTEQERRHKAIEKKLLELPEFRYKKVSRRDIERYKLWEEFGGRSPYDPVYQISLSALYSGAYDIEHIIPKSRLFDDSFSNKTICPRHLNSGEIGKNQYTAFDFMKMRDPDTFERYLNIIEEAFKRKENRLSRVKREKLLMSLNDIPQDFIARQLRQTQYISRKSIGLLKGICRNVYATSGSVTDFLRHEWGYDEILMNLQLPLYKEHGFTEEVIVQHAGQKHKKEVINGWTKRDDHRHHALDALVIACTTQGMIQRLNNLNQIAQHSEDVSRKADLKNKGGQNLRKYVAEIKPLSTAEVEKGLKQVLVSFKSGKKVATKGKRIVKEHGRKKVVQTDIIIPRGALSEETVYGQIEVTSRKEVKLTSSFHETEHIAKKKIREIIQKRLAEFGNDPSKAFKNLKQNPIWEDEEGAKTLTSVPVAVKEKQFVVKYKIEAITEKDIPFIVDEGVKRAVASRLAQFKGNHKEAFKDLANNPVWLNEERGIAIKSVRCFTGLGKLEALHCSKNGFTYPISKVSEFPDSKPIDYVKPGNNHHLSIFEDENGNLKDIMTSFWEAVERKRQGVPLIVKEHPEGYRFITSFQQNEMFIYHPEGINKILGDNKAEFISKSLYRVQKISKTAKGQINIFFRHHLETAVGEDEIKKVTGKYLNIQSLDRLKCFTKVSISILGEIKTIQK
ncbi:MAG: type II CRISPR RNA-guided endonuclease Cas9 [Chitinophagales bacterium]